MHRVLSPHRAVLLATLCLTAATARAQLQLTTPAPSNSSAATLTDPSFDASIQPLLDADRQFAEDTQRGGGKAFLAWFLDDAVTLSNGKPVVQGKAALGHDFTWDAKDYQLVWSPDGGRIGPSHDMGVTWGTYQGHSHDHQGNPVVTSGRYITVWKKDTAGHWKVLVDASNEAPPESGACCSLH